MLIAAIPRTFTNVGRTFALYPDQPDAETVIISAWARCEQCDIVDDSKPLDIISHYTAIPIQRLQEIIAANESFFLIYLRVYRLPKSITIPARSQGQYVALPDRLKVVDSSPILSDPDFSKIKQKLEDLEPPEPLDIQIQRILDQAELQYNLQLSKELDWIDRISKVGNSSGGHEFEKLVRKSFIHLGFSNSNTNPKASLDPEATGGAGGIDLCCELPYPVVGECKASANKAVLTKVCGQLTDLGKGHFLDHYEKAVKIIIAAGSLNRHSKPIAINSKMNVIKPETLEKLVKLKLTYSVSINLRELKSCLESEPFGEDANTKLLNFIDRSEREIREQIKLRSQIIQAVKDLQEANPEWSSSAEIRTQYNANNKGSILDIDIIRDLLIELSSPLAGYLGRVEEKGKKCDRFYYLRDLPI